MVLDLKYEDIQDQNVLAEKLTTLAEIIVRKHYYASVKEKEDLVSVGVLKALTLISENRWTPEKGSFVGFIYTGMRNDMHNYLYHENKFIKVDPESMPEQGKSDVYFQDSVYVNYNVLHSVCRNFSNIFGEGLEARVIEELKNVGYEIRGMGKKAHTPICYNNLLVEKYGKDIEEDVVGRVIGIILWKRKDRVYA